MWWKDLFFTTQSRVDQWRMSLKSLRQQQQHQVDQTFAISPQNFSLLSLNKSNFQIFCHFLSSTRSQWVFTKPLDQPNCSFLCPFDEGSSTQVSEPCQVQWSLFDYIIVIDKMKSLYGSKQTKKRQRNKSTVLSFFLRFHACWFKIALFLAISFCSLHEKWEERRRLKNSYAKLKKMSKFWKENQICRLPRRRDDKGALFFQTCSMLRVAMLAGHVFGGRTALIRWQP